MLPLSPERVAQNATFLSFLGIKVNFNQIKPAAKFLCVKSSSGNVVVQPIPYLMAYTLARTVTFQPKT